MYFLRIVFVTAVNFVTISQCLDDVRQPPSILESPPSSITCRTSAKIELPCSASGTPKPTYEWLRDGQTLNMNSLNIDRLNDGKIQLKKVGALDEGYYKCIASNQFGIAHSNTTVLRRAFLQEPPVATVTNKTVKEGEPFFIEFMPLRSLPRPKIRWESADKIGTADSTSKDIITSKRIQWAENGNLYFSYALAEDALEGRIYKGLTINHIVDVSSGGSYTRLTVERAPGGLTPFRPSLSFSSPTQIIGLEDGDITLRCFFAGYPDPKIQWTGSNKFLSRSRFTYTNSDTELTLTSLKQSDAAEYRCTGSNEKGVTSHNISLIVQAAPVFNQSFRGPRNVNVTEGESVTFQCNSYAKPKATVVWMINGVPVNAGDLPRRVSISSSGHNLTVRSVCRDCIDPVSSSDLMVIQCNASNEHGYTYAAGYLNVLKKTTVKLVTERKVIVKGNSQNAVSFQCVSSSDPSTPVQILWYRLVDSDQWTVVYSEPPVVAVGNGTLTITAGNNASDWAKHGGEYKCVVDNGYSGAEEWVEIQVNVESVTVMSTASVLDLWWIFIIIACLFLILILILICCICIFRNRGDKYDVDDKERKCGNNPEKELASSGFHDYQRREIEPFKGSQDSLGSSARLFGDEDLSEIGDHKKSLENGSYLGLSSANTADRKRGRSEFI